MTLVPNTGARCASTTAAGKGRVSEDIADGVKRMGVFVRPPASESTAMYPRSRLTSTMNALKVTGGVLVAELACTVVAGAL